MATTLILNRTSTGVGDVLSAKQQATFQAVGATTSGSGAATVEIKGSNDGVNFITIATISLTLGTAQTTDGVVIEAPWGSYLANLSAISGTGANVQVIAGHA